MRILHPSGERKCVLSLNPLRPPLERLFRFQITARAEIKKYANPGNLASGARGVDPGNHDSKSKSGQQAPIDQVSPAGNERRARAGQEEHEFSNLLRTSHATQRMPPPPLLDGPLWVTLAPQIGGPAKQRRVNGARADTVDADVFFPVLETHAARQGHNAAFGGAVR